MFRPLIILALIGALACPGCKDKAAITTPAGVIPKDSMVMMLRDIHLLEAAANLNKLGHDHHASIAIYRYIYKKYGIDKEQFDKSFQFYSKQPELLEAMYEEVINELSEMQGREVNSRQEGD